MMVRVAFREEGEFWNAYMARQGTMEGAILLGSILIGAVRQDPGIKCAFMEAMKGVLALSIKNVTGEPPDEWIEQKAPESERTRE